MIGKAPDCDSDTVFHMFQCLTLSQHSVSFFFSLLSPFDFRHPRSHSPCESDLLPSVFCRPLFQSHYLHLCRLSLLFGHECFRHNPARHTQTQMRKLLIPKKPNNHLIPDMQEEKVGWGWASKYAASFLLQKHYGPWTFFAIVSD